MARARNIKPSFFTNDTLSECSRDARLLFIGLWTIADREGRLHDKPKRIKVEVFPYDNDVDCDELLNQLALNGFIKRYEVDGNRYISIPNFAKHQNPHFKEKASEIPAFSASPEQALDKHQPNPKPSALNPESGILNPERGKMNDATSVTSHTSMVEKKELGDTARSPMLRDPEFQDLASRFIAMRTKKHGKPGELTVEQWWMDLNRMPIEHAKDALRLSISAEAKKPIINGRDPPSLSTQRKTAGQQIAEDLEKAFGGAS